MIKTFEKIMMAQNAHAVKYIKVFSLNDAKGKIKEINNQINRDFGYSGPFAISSISERVHAVRWANAREVITVQTNVSRVTKEIVAAGVSQSNKCAYCEDVHGTAISSAGDPMTSKALANGNWNSLSDKRTKEIIKWSLNNKNPNADIILNPPFSAQEAPEIIGTALAFHSINRLVDIFLFKSPFPKLLTYPIIKNIANFVASKTIFKSMVSKNVRAGDSISFIDNLAISEKNKWAEHVPSYSKGLEAKKVLLIELEREYIPSSVSSLFNTHLSEWNGEDMPIGRKWLNDILEPLEKKEKTLTKMIFLSAFAPYTISNTDVSSFRNSIDSDKAFLEICYWSIETLTSRISEWLTKPFLAK